MGDLAALSSMAVCLNLLNFAEHLTLEWSVYTLNLEANLIFCRKYENIWTV